MKLTLPVFKTTQRSPSGVIHRNVPRGKKTVDCVRNDDNGVAEKAACSLDSASSDDPIPEPSLDDDDDKNDGDSKNVSLHTIKQKASTSAWASI